jgi:hypothetical protein
LHGHIKMNEQLDIRIDKLVNEKVPVTGLVQKNCAAWFDVFKIEAQKLVQHLYNTVEDKSLQPLFAYDERGSRQCSVRVGEDLIVFHVRSNTFRFDDAHFLNKTSYVKANPLNGFCGIINVYNFLNESMLKSKENDVGFLLARVFINREHHFYVEGKKQIGLLYNDFTNEVIDASKIETIIKSILIFSLEHDLFVAPFEAVQSITVNELQNNIFSTSLASSKRLGYRLSKDENKTE